jgi:hypothetical protein
MRALEERNDSAVIEVRGLRRAIGLIAVLLPWTLMLSERLRHVLFGGRVGPSEPWIESSISAYFHTGVREIFVGALGAIGVFLLAYRGVQRIDNLASNLAGFLALVVAAVPTPERPRQPESPLIDSVTLFSDAHHMDPVVVGHIHFAAAALLFAVLAYMSLSLFTRTDQVVPTPQKRARNVVYVVSGVTIVVAIAAIAVVKLTKVEGLLPGIVFWLETVAMTAFGVSWLTKSEIILADEPPSDSRMPRAFA